MVTRAPAMPWRLWSRIATRWSRAARRGRSRCGSKSARPRRSRTSFRTTSRIPAAVRELFRRQLEQLAVRVVGQHVDGTVRKDSHVANALVEIREQWLFVDDLVVLAQLETENRLASQAADEDA